MLLKFAFIVLLLVDIEVLGLQRSHRWPRKKRPHRLYRIPTKMPSGVLYNITVPTTETRCDTQTTSTLIDLDPKGRMGKIEYNIVKTELETTWSGGFTATGHQVHKIQKISNPCLWKRYKHSKETVRREARTTNEQMLFHGSPAALQLVNTGFDERYANPNGMLGAGIYFADNGAKSDGYNAGSNVKRNKLMLLCRVTLGKMFTQTERSRYPHAPPGYHSVLGNYHLREYVVYRGEQVYPEYLITYT